jgi:hypothetical protein
MIDPIKFTRLCCECKALFNRAAEENLDHCAFSILIVDWMRDKVIEDSVTLDQAIKIYESTLLALRMMVDIYKEKEHAPA